jgi:uncharacterized protein
MLSWVKRYPLLCYFTLAYGLTWGGIVAALAAGVVEIGKLEPSGFLAVFAAMALGPSFSAVALTTALEGRTGLHALWRHMTHWRVGPAWYAVALFTAPALFVPILLVLGASVDPVFYPQWNLYLFAIGIVAGAFEEIGWTGFATPRLLANTSLPLAGLTLGLVWAAWHGLADFTGNTSAMGALWPLWFGAFWLAALPPYRLLMTWLYARTASGLLAVLMQAGYTGWLFALSPATTFEQGLIWQGTFAAALWVVALTATGLSWRNRSPRREPGMG